MDEAIQPLWIGQSACLTRTFTESDVKKCSELTGDYSPVYFADQEAWKHLYAKPIVPGLLTEGLITQVVSRKLPGCPCLLLQKELIFCRPVHVGDEITAHLEIIDIHDERNWVTQKVNCYNQHGDEVVKGQIIIFVIPHGA